MGSNGRMTCHSASVMSEAYHRTCSGPSAALPNLCARQSHDRDCALDSTHASAKDCGNYQKALLSCAGSRAISRTGTLFDQASPRDR
ncbi:hypothetical protein GCM10009601_24570 [Streptomyces thermospinosisporus]|uniref:Uncharacterized protein n=1 Tax=Streptomyces thermospinosisporus TaxID=161482 RepID=A0ABP4JL96_9ACTN